MDTTKIKETQMAKTPEELTEDWLNNKLQAGSFWFVETEDSNPEPMVVDMDGDFNDYEGNYYRPSFSNGKLKVLAPVPSYDEYKAIQEELAEHRHYCCCMENEVMRLDKAKLEEENKNLSSQNKHLSDLIADQDKEIGSLRQKNQIWAELAENLLCLEEKNWENLVLNGTKEQRLDFLKHKEKYSILAALGEYQKMKEEKEKWAYECGKADELNRQLRALLKEGARLLSFEHETYEAENFIKEVNEVLK